MTTPTAQAIAASESLDAAALRGGVEAISAALSEPAWLLEWRLEALDRALAMDWPDRKAEEWRRTPADRLPFRAAPAVPSPVPPNGRQAESPSHQFFPTPGQAYLHHFAGRAVAGSPPGDGAILMPLSAAAREHGDLVRDRLAAAGAAPLDRFDAFGRALWTQGVFCYAPPGAHLRDSLHHLVSEAAAKSDAWTYALVVAGRDSRLSLVEAGASTAEIPAERGGLIHLSLDLAVDDGADLHLAAVQNWRRGVAALTTARADVGRDARLRYTTASFGGDLDKQRIDVRLAQRGGHADIRGLFVGTRDQHVEHVTRQHHAGAGASSDLLIRGVLEDDSHAVQYGVIRIDPEGQQTNAYQTMRNLLLDEGAGADPIPVLEIEADDVKCSHAAAVGPVSPEQLFYLQTRGIPPDEAERLIVRGFLAEIADGIADGHLRDAVEDLIEAELHIKHAEPAPRRPAGARA